MTIEQFAKLREWILNGGAVQVFVDDCYNLMWLLRNSKCWCEYVHSEDGLCWIFPHFGN